MAEAVPGRRNLRAERRWLRTQNSARVSSTPAPSASAVSQDKVTDVDHWIFGDRKFYAMTLNMPNLNSAGGSWVIRFAELKGARKMGMKIRES